MPVASSKQRPLSAWHNSKTPNWTIDADALARDVRLPVREDRIMSGFDERITPNSSHRSGRRIALSIAALVASVSAANAAIPSLNPTSTASASDGDRFGIV